MESIPNLFTDFRNINIYLTLHKNFRSAQQKSDKNKTTVSICHYCGGH